jgi:hypothetical protein
MPKPILLNCLFCNEELLIRNDINDFQCQFCGHNLSVDRSMEPIILTEYHAKKRYIDPLEKRKKEIEWDIEATWGRLGDREENECLDQLLKNKEIFYKKEAKTKFIESLLLVFSIIAFVLFYYFNFLSADKLIFILLFCIILQYFFVINRRGFLRNQQSIEKKFKKLNDLQIELSEINSRIARSTKIKSK